MENVQETVSTVEAALRRADLSVDRLLTAAVMLVVGVVAVRLLTVLTGRVLSRAQLDEGVRGLLKGASRFLLGFVLAVAVLAYLNVEVTSLVALLSLAGLAVSLALQNLLSNVAAGLQLLSTKPFVQGDTIEADGEKGLVAETGIFYTRLRTADNKTVQIPNSEVTKGKIVNYSTEASRRVDMSVSLSWEAPAEVVKAVIRQVMEAHPLVLPEPEPMVRMGGLGEGTVEYVFRVWCANGDYWTVYFDLLEGVKAALDGEGIGPARRQVSVHTPGGRDAER